MNTEKGESAFESVDDVLAQETDSAGTSGPRIRRKKDETKSAQDENPQTGQEAPETPAPPAGDGKRDLIIAACIGLGLLLLGLMCLGGCKKSRRR
jgi:hypothetical protein